MVSAGLSTFLNMIGALNIVCFQLMLNLDYPANVQLIMGNILKLLQADVIDPVWLDGSVFDYSSDERYVEYAMDQNHPMFLKKQIYDCGFETYNPVLNLGGLYGIFVLLAM